MSESPLAKLSRVELQFLQRAIKRNQIPTPISEMALNSLGRGGLFAKLGPLAGAPKDAALALLDFALAKPTVGGGGGPATSSVVWTGPEVHLSPVRPTTAAVLEVLQAARKSVLIAGYEFDHGAVLFEALSAAMREHGVKVSVYLDIRRASTKNTNMDAYLAIQAHNFVYENWPFGEPLPDLYYFPAGAEAGSYKSLHAKCIVVDGETVLVGSANFTRRGHERNIEVGVCTKDAKLAKTLSEQFERLVEAGELAPLPAPAAPKVVVPEEAEDEELDDEDLEDDVSEALTGWPDSVVALLEEQCVPTSLWKFYSRVLQRGLDTPDVGDDIDEGGKVIGTAELFWLEQKVAILVEEQLGCRNALEAAGWHCFDVHEVHVRESEIFDRLERRG